MRILIIGTGSIGLKHIRNVQKIMPNTKFILLRKCIYQDELSSALRADVYDNIEQALQLKPDCAIVATPSALHIQSLLPLIKANIPFYIEKPVVTEHLQIEQLKLTLDREKYTSITAVGCNLRFLPSLKKIKTYLERNALGNVIRANFQAGLWLPDWRKNIDYTKSYSAHTALGGGVVFDLIHELDIAQWFFGDFDLAYSMLGKLSNLKITSEDTACILLGKKAMRGPIVNVNLDYISRRLVRRYEIVGEIGTLKWDLPTQKLEFITAESIKKVDCGEDGFDINKTYYTAMAEFLSNIPLNKKCTIDIWDGINSSRLALQVKGVSYQ